MARSQQYEQAELLFRGLVATYPDMCKAYVSFAQVCSKLIAFVSAARGKLAAAYTAVARTGLNSINMCQLASDRSRSTISRHLMARHAAPAGTDFGTCSGIAARNNSTLPLACTRKLCVAPVNTAA